MKMNCQVTNRNALVEPVEIEVTPECAELLRVWDMAATMERRAKQVLISDLVRKRDREFMGMGSDGDSGA